MALWCGYFKSFFSFWAFIVGACTISGWRIADTIIHLLSVAWERIVVFELLDVSQNERPVMGIQFGLLTQYLIFPGNCVPFLLRLHIFKNTNRNIRNENVKFCRCFYFSCAIQVKSLTWTYILTVGAWGQKLTFLP